MHLIVIGWLFVVLLMAAAEAVSPVGSLIGALFTLVGCGLLPVALLVYLGRAAARRRARANTSAADPDRRGQAPADAVPPVREEP